MADRSIAAGDSLRKLFIEFNATAEDIGDISGVTDASGIIASATDVVEAVELQNTDLTLVAGLLFLKVRLAIVLKLL